MDKTFTQTTETMAERMRGIRIANFNPNDARLIVSEEKQGVTQQEFTDVLRQASRKITSPDEEKDKA